MSGGYKRIALHSACHVSRTAALLLCTLQQERLQVMRSTELSLH